MMVFQSAVDLIGLLPSHTDAIIAYLRATGYSCNLCKVKLSDELIFFSERGLIHETLINTHCLSIEDLYGKFFRNRE